MLPDFQLEILKLKMCDILVTAMRGLTELLGGGGYIKNAQFCCGCFHTALSFSG